MRTNMTIYEGGFVNTETNVANENIQQLIIIRLFDTETVVTDAHNTLYRVASNGDGTQAVFITWDATGSTASFGYNNGAWVDTEIDLSGSATITIPEGDYTYSILVDAVRSELSEGETIDLEMGETPLRYLVDDEDEDKFTPVKSKRVEIQIHSSDVIDISVFADGGDNRWYTETETAIEGIIFKGFLSISDLEQEFMPDPNIILLTATDGLGFLNDEPLVNFDNETPTGVYPIIKFLTWALAKTGLSLDIKACMNIREQFAVPLVSDDSGVGHFYTHEHIDAKTFEDEVGTCIDCKTVLEYILGENSFLKQYKGKWIIVRVDEMETGHEYYFTRFDHTGTWVENTEETYTKDIGVDLPLSFMNDDAVVSLERPYKKIITSFNFNYPEEIVCNIDLERGAGDEPDPTAPTETIEYEPECIGFYANTFNGTTWVDGSPQSGSRGDLVKIFEYGYEKERYLVAEHEDVVGDDLVHYFKFTPIDVSEFDKINLTFDFKLDVDGFTSLNPGQVTIVPNDGSDPWFWELDTNSNVNQWVQRATITTNPWSTNLRWQGTNSDEWQSVGEESRPAPASGKLYIRIGTNFNVFAPFFFININIELSPFVNGSYKVYTGQTHSVSIGNDKIKAVRETEVFISDAPRTAMKGCLLKEGVGNEIYAGIADFGNFGDIQIDGNVEGSFPIGTKITVSGSASNNITATITDTNYSLIGDLTTITTDGTTTSEINASITVTEVVFVLTEGFYNAAKLTAGPTGITDISPYGQIQAFDVWNQFNRVMRTFEGKIDRTDSGSELPDLLHKYILRDISGNTTDGLEQYRIFQLLHFEMDMHLCEWDAFFHEVFNTDNEKEYTGHEFKYLTSE